MQWSFVFLFNSILLGVGLAMDAFSVSMANGLNEPKMKKRKLLGIAGVFAAFRQSCRCSVGFVFIPLSNVLRCLKNSFRRSHLCCLVLSAEKCSSKGFETRILPPSSPMANGSTPRLRIFLIEMNFLPTSTAYSAGLRRFCPLLTTTS